MSAHGVAPTLAAADLLWSEVYYATYRAAQPTANASGDGGPLGPGQPATLCAFAATPGVQPATRCAPGRGDARADATVNSASLDALLAPLQALPSRPRDAADAGAPDGFGAYDQPAAMEDGGGGGGGGRVGGAGVGGSEGMVGGAPLILGAGGDAPRTWLERHAAPVARSGHTLTAVRVNMNAGAGARAGGGVGVGGEGEGEGEAESEVLLLFGGEAAARVEHRVAEEFEASSPPATACMVA